MTMTTRLTWLGKLLGVEKAESVVADTRQAADLLDGAGVERKAMPPEAKPDGKPKDEDETPPPDGDQPEDEAQQGEGDMVTEVGAKLAEQIFDAAEGDLSTLNQEQLATVIADALRPAVEAEAPAAPPPSEEPQMEDSNKAITPVGANEAQTALGEMLSQMVKDQGEMAKAYEPLTAKLASVETELATVKALVPVVEQLTKLVTDLQAQLNDRPRQASAATETALDGDTDAAKALKKAIEKGTNGKATVLGFPLKD